METKAEKVAMYVGMSSLFTAIVSLIIVIWTRSNLMINITLTSIVIFGVCVLIGKALNKD
jgi:small basic protein